MTDSVPSRGSVIRYAYLWADESAAGQEEGVKDRPAVVLAIAVRSENGETKILVVPITHSPPRRPEDAVPLPPDEAARLGLDQLPSWIVTTEGNAFIWPGPDIRPVPGPAGRLIQGQISEKLLRLVARSYLANRQQGFARLVPRTT
jgi:mRNA-degrading endonuclease toxin of MazEF toxin-antitoxin module